MESAILQECKRRLFSRGFTITAAKKASVDCLCSARNEGKPLKGEEMHFARGYESRNTPQKWRIGIRVYAKMKILTNNVLYAILSPRLALADKFSRHFVREKSSAKPYSL